MPAKTKLTKRVVDAAAPTATRSFVWDSELRGFGLRVEASGTKTFIVRYRPRGTGRNGPKRFYKIGRYDSSMTPEKARDKARVIIGQVAQGQDPALARDKTKNAATLTQLVDRFLEDEVRPKKKAGTAALYEHHLKKLAVPVLGASKAPAAITRADVSRVHRTIGKTRKVTANRVIATLSGLMQFAIKEGEIEGPNVAKGIELFEEQARERFLSTDELGRLGQALHEAETTGLPYAIKDGPNAKHAPKPENRVRKVDAYAIAAIRLLMFTGARLREVLHAKWEYLDEEKGILRLPTSKTGAKTIYLNAPALALLSALPRIEGNPFVFPGEKDQAARVDLKKPWAAVTQAAGLSGLRIHDLRHTFAAYGAGSSMSLHIIGKLLGHSKPETTQRYAHLDLDPMHRAVNTIGAQISAAMQKRAGADVVPLKRQG